jgi:hypothetical protein
MLAIILGLISAVVLVPREQSYLISGQCLEKVVVASILLLLTFNITQWTNKSWLSHSQSNGAPGWKILLQAAGLSYPSFDRRERSVHDTFGSATPSRVEEALFLQHQPLTNISHLQLQGRK